MVKYSVRLTLDETFEIEADDEEDATAQAWDEVFAIGAYGVEVREEDET